MNVCIDIYGSGYEHSGSQTDILYIGVNTVFQTDTYICTYVRMYVILTYIDTYIHTYTHIHTGIYT